MSCTKEDNPSDADTNTPELVSLDDLAGVLSSLPMEIEHLNEVYDAVSASVDNGYDSEYTMSQLFGSPGSGVGSDLLDDRTKAASGKTYRRPLRDLFAEYYSEATKASGGSVSAAQYMNYISQSDIQIYWPFAEKWDGRSYPVITFDPLNGDESNIGWYMDENGEMQSITVTEDVAKTRPVWVINNNDDSRHTTIDILKKNNPQWGEGGTIVIGPNQAPASTKAAPVKSLVLKDITLKRPYDSWFRGASELFFKIGSLESFDVSKESDIYLYSPTITDFMVVVRRSEVGKTLELNTLLVSEWTPQLQNCAFMIIEDDGGTITSWNCNAVVKYNSKSYGFEISIPYRSRDDIVWRGQLSRKYIEATDNVTGNFGDVQLTFSINEL